MVSKPIVPPWNDGTKNLVRDLATQMRRHQAVVFGTRGVQVDLGRARVERIYPAASGGFAPALRDRAVVTARLALGRGGHLWHFFFAPNPASSRVAAWTSRGRRRATVQTVCSAPRPDADLGRVLFGDRVVVLSRHTERRLREGGVAEGVLRRIAPCVTPLAPLDDEARARVRQALGLPLDVPLVVYPGDLEFSSAAERVVRAHARLAPSTDAWLVMACRPKTPAAHAREGELRQLATSLRVERSMRWVGEVAGIHDLIGAADVVSLPADDLYAKLDLPLVLLEAQSMGRAVIVSEAGAAVDLAEGGAARAVRPDVEAVAEATRALIEDSASRAALGAVAREAVRTRHGPAAMAAAYEALYDELLE